MSAMDDEERCRLRAHELWEAAGRPEGRDLEAGDAGPHDASDRTPPV